jgi:hypothetical protein
MRRKRSKISPLLVAGIWAINLLGLAVAAILLLGTPGQAAPAETGQAQPAPVLPVPSRTPAPGAIVLPSATRSANTQIPGFEPSPVTGFGLAMTPTSIAPGSGPYSIGTSVAGRPIEVYVFGSGPKNRLIVAGIHGGSEWNTVALSELLIAYVRDHPDVVPQDITLHIVLSLNPDGLTRAHGPEGRVNEHGVDLNRNWPFNWQADWDRSGCWQSGSSTGGMYGGSEPETQALMAYIQATTPDALISYHSAALGIFAGGVPTLRESHQLARALSKVGGYKYPPVNTGCQYTGDLTDWASSVMGIPAVDIELSTHSSTDLAQNLEILHAFLNWEKK